MHMPRVRHVIVSQERRLIHTVGRHVLQSMRHMKIAGESSKRGVGVLYLEIVVTLTSDCML